MHSLDLKVSKYKDAYSSNFPQSHIRLGSVFNAIKSGSAGIKKGVETARVFVAKDGTKSPKYSELKKGLPSFTVAGTFSKRNKKSIQTYTSYTILDIDEIQKEEKDVIKLKEAIIKIDTTLCCFISPSGDGLKVIVPIDSDAEHHDWATRQVMQFYAKKLGIKIDPSGKDICRLCFYSYDPDIRVDKSAKIFKISLKLDMDSRVKKAIKLTKDKQVFKEGNRSNFIFLLAFYLNKFGIDKHIAFKNLEKYEDNGFQSTEIKDIIESAYKNNSEHGIWENYNAKIKTFEYSELHKQLIEEIEIDLGIDKFKVISEELIAKLLLSCYQTTNESLILNCFFENDDWIVPQLEDNRVGRLLKEMINNKQFELDDWLNHSVDEINQTANDLHKSADKKFPDNPISLQILVLRHRHKKLKAAFEKMTRDCMFSKKENLKEISSNLQVVSDLNQTCIESIQSLFTFYEESRDQTKHSK